MGAGGAVADDPAHRAWYYVDADERTDEVRAKTRSSEAKARAPAEADAIDPVSRGP